MSTIKLYSLGGNSFVNRMDRFNNNNIKILQYATDFSLVLGHSSSGNTLANHRI
ncbi:hypothetical protein [Candidatus Ruthturnera calyptogenae]|uniref:hypothetical protein n=1 Tax=Candidatus Ruthturnera calyptogenae TaxID=386487 RepID=UPI0002ED7731|nr:hypothetical protein [Candidatus Ruthturnera calyptogenae]